MSEYERILTRYFDSKDNRIHVYYDFDQIELNKLIIHLGKYEKPDMLSMYDNKIIAMEHFEFDSFKNFNKGSDFQRKESQIMHKFDEKVKKELAYKKNIISTERLVSSASLDNYYNNFIKIFKNHYNKLDSYQEHINKDFNCETKNIEYWFFVEDVSPLGSYYLNKQREICLLNPLYCDKIKDLLRKSKKIKGILFGQYAMNEYRLSLIVNTEKTFEIFDTENPEIEEKDFFYFEPHTTGFATIIPKE